MAKGVCVFHVERSLQEEENVTNLIYLLHRQSMTQNVKNSFFSWPSLFALQPPLLIALARCVGPLGRVVLLHPRVHLLVRAFVTGRPLGPLGRGGLLRDYVLDFRLLTSGAWSRFYKLVSAVNYENKFIKVIKNYDAIWIFRVIKCKNCAQICQIKCMQLHS
jgi:hypothetical protein